MTAMDRTELARALDAVAQGVPGVDALYRAGGWGSRIVAAGTEALSGQETPRVHLSDDADGVLSVSAHIGVATESARETGRAVHEAIARALADHEPGARIRVTVVHVAGRGG